MNRDRRTSLVKIVEIIDNAKSELEVLRDEEQEYFDNMPESVQSSGKGLDAEDVVSSMDSAIDSLGDALYVIVESILRGEKDEKN